MECDERRADFNTAAARQMSPRRVEDSGQSTPRRFLQRKKSVESADMQAGTDSLTPLRNPTHAQETSAHPNLPPQMECGGSNFDFVKV